MHGVGIDFAFGFGCSGIAQTGARALANPWGTVATTKSRKEFDVVVGLQNFEVVALLHPPI